MEKLQTDRQRNLRFAAQAFHHASTWWVSALGGLIGGLFLWLIGAEMPISSNPLWANIITLCICVIVGLVIAFAMLYLWAPIYYRLKRYGGLRSWLRIRLGVQMWPIVLMSFGIFAFFVLVGSGGIWFLVKLLRHPQVMEATNYVSASPKKPQLTAAEEQFRLELRKFVLSPLDELRIEFSKVIFPLMNSEGEALRFFSTEAIQGGFFRQVDAARIMASQGIGDINSADLQHSIVKVLEDYTRGQSYVRILAKSNGIEEIRFHM